VRIERTSGPAFPLLTRASLFPRSRCYGRDALILVAMMRMAVSVVVLIPMLTLAVAQDSRSPADIIDLHQVEYPPIAKAARVSGDVKLGITLGKDGLPVSVDVESGPPMLRQAAVESASHSRFKTRAATPDVVEIIYKFVFDEPVCNPSQDESRSRMGNVGNVVTVKARPAMLCDPAAVIVQTHVRSARCLYLWRCSTKRITPVAR